MTSKSIFVLAMAASGLFADSFLLPSSPLRTTVLRQLPDQNGGWMQDGALGTQTGTYSRPMTEPPITEPGQPLAPSGRSYYPRKDQQVQERRPNMPQINSHEDTSWWGTPGGVSGAAEYYYPRRGSTTEDSPYPETIQGAGSRRTWDTSQHDQTNFVVGSHSGRPVYANVQVWEGPNNTPASMQLYSEDGNMRPWSAGFQNTFRSGGTSALNIRNTGPMEFPVQATVEGSYDGSRGQPIGDHITATEKQQERQYKNIAKSQTVQGESLKTFSVGPDCQAVRVELFSEGRPMYAQVELWQGPNNIQQCAEIYTDNGNDRLWSAVIPTPGYACTVAIRNIGPMAYPIKATVDALQ